MKIVICEENPTLALDLWQLLHQQGHCICGFAKSTTDCLEKVALTCPDLVVVDDEAREGLTGLSLVETLEMSGFPSVVISGEPQEVVPRTSARAVLGKPLSEAAVAAAMAKASRDSGRNVPRRPGSAQTRVRHPNPDGNKVGTPSAWKKAFPTPDKDGAAPSSHGSAPG